MCRSISFSLHTVYVYSLVVKGSGVPSGMIDCVQHLKLSACLAMMYFLFGYKMTQVRFAITGMVTWSVKYGLNKSLMAEWFEQASHETYCGLLRYWGFTCSCSSHTEWDISRVGCHIHVSPGKAM